MEKTGRLWPGVHKTIKIPAKNDTFRLIRNCPDVRALLDAFRSDGIPLRLVGGAVRDALIGGLNPDDLDFSTPATPDQMKAVLTKPGTTTRFTVIPTKSLFNHNTALVRINSRKTVEITTLLSTEDASEADVWRQDASRRDVNINNLSVCFQDELIHDFHGGFESIFESGTATFIGDPRIRIAEDPLRLLRYFRAQSLLNPDKFHPETLEAIKDDSRVKRGVGDIIGANLYREWKKILSRDVETAVKVTRKMLECELGPVLGLPAKVETPDVTGIERLEPASVLALLIRTPEDEKRLRRRLGYSRWEKFLIQSILRWRNNENFDLDICKELLKREPPHKLKKAEVRKVLSEVAKVNKDEKLAREIASIDLKTL